MKSKVLGFVSLCLLGATPILFASAKSQTVDSHIHLASPLNWEAAGASGSAIEAKDVLPLLDNAKVDVGIAFSGAYFFKDLKRAQEENNFVASEVAKHPTRFIGVCSVHITASWKFEEIRRCAEDLKLRGLKLHPQGNGLDLRNPKTLALIDPLLKAAGKYNLPVVFDSVWLDSHVTLEMLKLVVSNPNTKVIFAHAFFKDYRDLSVAALIYQMYPKMPRNLYVDLSATAVFFADSREKEDIVWHLRKFGISNVLMGSDFPVHTPEQAVNALKLFPFTEAELQQILGNNARALFKK